MATIVDVTELQSYSFPKLLSLGITFLKLLYLLARIRGKVLFEELQNLAKPIQYCKVKKKKIDITRKKKILMLLLISCFSRVRLCATPWTVAYQAPPYMGVSRQEYWSGLPLPSPQNLNKYLQISNNIRHICNRDITYSNLE